MIKIKRRINRKTAEYPVYTKQEADDKNIKYLFIHNSASNGKIFNEELIEKKLNINRNDIIFINPNYNIYCKDHKFYEISNIFVNKPILSYIKTIINSEYIILTDSSFFCLSLNLPIKTKNCFYISRGKVDYSYLYDKKYKCPNYKSIFKSL